MVRGPEDGDEAERGPSRSVSRSSWVGVAVIGVVLFLLGIYASTWRPVPDGAYVSVAVAAAGGVLFVLGLSKAAARPPREKSRRQREVELAPSFEIYDPGAREESTGAVEPPR